MAEKVFNKKPAELSAEEKETLRIASMLAGGLVGAVANNNNTNHGANGLARATEGMATAQRAVENNYLHSGEVESLIRELAKAEKEGRDTKPIFEKYARLSEKNRQEILQECGDNPACYIPHMYMMNTGDKEAYENFSGLRFTTYFNGLSAETRAAMHDFVTNENAITRDALPWTIHAGMAALEFGEAIGAGAAIVNGKNLISSGKRPQVEGNARSQANTKENTGRTSKASPSLTSENVPNKPHYTVGKNGKIDYSSSGFDYERRLVGDSDYDMPKKQTETATANPMDSKPKSSGAEKPKSEFHSDLNIGKNRKDFNTELNHEISTREKDYVINQQASKRVVNVTAPIDFSHVVDGEVVKRNAVGGHSHWGTNIRILDESTPLKNGVYEAKISVLNPRTGRYVEKHAKSTMFPKSWTVDRIKVEVDVAYKNRRHFINEKGQLMWDGVTPSGVKVRGYLDQSPNGVINKATVFPIMGN